MAKEIGGKINWKTYKKKANELMQGIQNTPSTPYILIFLIKIEAWLIIAIVMINCCCFTLIIHYKNNKTLVFFV